jgi:ankyrin repeat protein
MNYTNLSGIASGDVGSIVKIVSLAVLAAIFGQVAQAMEMSKEKLNKALLKAAGLGNIAEITQLLKHGADINCKNIIGFTPLLYVIYSSSSNYLLMLTRLLAKPDVTDLTLLNRK